MPPPARAGGEAVRWHCGDVCPAEAVSAVPAVWLCQGNWSPVIRCLAAFETRAGRANPLPNLTNVPGPR